MSAHGKLADAYGRYATLISAQLEALDAGDSSAFEDLSRERDALADTIDAIHEQERPAHGQLEELRTLVQQCVNADRKLRARLEQLRSEHLGQAKQIEANRAAIRSYVPAAQAGNRLDLRL